MIYLRGSLVRHGEKVSGFPLQSQCKKIGDSSAFFKLSVFHNNEKPYAEGEILIENAVFHMLTESIEDG